jgi:hypothetical protein
MEDDPHLDAKMARFYKWGFDDTADYVASLKSAYGNLRTRAFSPVVPLEEVEETALPRTMTWVHVAALGVGLILGAGIFVSSGEAAAEIAGPAVILSFVVAGISAILSTLCYSEFAVRFPLSGGAFNYLLFSCGELVAFCCVTTLILEYVLANAAVARSFSPYFGQLIGKGSEFFVFERGEWGREVEARWERLWVGASLDDDGAAGDVGARQCQKA